MEKLKKTGANIVIKDSSVVINEIKNIGVNLNISLNDIAIWLQRYDPDYILEKLRMAKSNNSITNPTKWVQSALDKNYTKSEAADSLANPSCSGVPDVAKTRKYLQQQNAIRNEVQQQSTVIIDDGLNGLKKVGL